MPQPAHAPAVPAHPTQMDHTADPHTAAPAPATATRRPRMRDQAADNPLLTLFGGIIIALLISTLASSNLRIDDLNSRFDDLNSRFDDVNGRIDEMNDRITRLEAKIDAQDDKIHQIDLKLTALIAALNKTGEVDAALSGTIIDNTAAAPHPLPS